MGKGRTIEELIKGGWKFEYHKGTRFIGASHPNGGKFSVCELSQSVHTDMGDLGNIIAHALNSWGSVKMGGSSVR